MGSRRGKELAVAQAALNAAKEARIQEELDKKEHGIAEASKAAGLANEAAGKANERAETANERAEAIRQENLKLALQLESERLARLKLEESVAPRTLRSTNFSIERLHQFQGTPFIVRVIKDDAASDHFADEIVGVLKGLCSWRVLGKEIVDGYIPQGVAVEFEATDPFSENAKKLRRSASDLSEYLEANGIDSRARPMLMSADGAPKDVIVVSVGMKPVEHPLPTGVPVLDKRDEERRIEKRERIERLRKEWKLIVE